MRGMAKLVLFISLSLCGCWHASGEVTERNGKSDRSIVCPETAPSASPFEIVVPLKDGAFYLGDVSLRTDGTRLLLDQKAFVTAVKSILRNEVVDRIPTPEAGSTFVSAQTLCQSGFKTSFDASVVELHFFPTVEQRVRGVIDSGKTKVGPKSDSLHKPATVSGYINNFITLDYDHLASSNDTFSGRVDFDGALTWGGWVLEGELGFSPTTGPSYFAKRLVFDDVDAATRYTLGDLYPALAGYQMGGELAGISVQRAYSKLAPDKNTRPTGKRSFRIEKPSSVTVYVNNNVARRLRLGPGEYDLSDLPLRGGTNMITLDVVADTGEKSKLEFTVFFNRSLLEPGIDEFAFNAGLMRETNTDGLFAVDESLFLSGFYRLGVTEAITTDSRHK
ncbi:MAG: hypothetical protein H7Y09_03170 [Chitinophagaceae bacterium]|nr:hypothetical protein [Anaerolineae bacterium]